MTNLRKLVVKINGLSPYDGMPEKFTASESVLGGLFSI
ncbi:hypothetical protein GECvBN5_gp013 [Salmonella phage GEC_vB_N5]|uniref:Uncharacterized protein n=2 Tax=Markadamsvirinae TaxID=2732013 RepID=A0A7S9SRM0_9CAUD|nr:hypothetical protein GECvBN3_gp013 [Salmonella phage GEC_vB_N3]QPI15029.1 hypothetical protein GECvBN5_gp013 [Salmonella phage GEC_vB_N5]